MELLRRSVEVSHTTLAKVSRVILVEVDAVMMLSSGVTSTTWMLAVFADSTVTGGNVAALLAVLLEGSRLLRGSSGSVRAEAAAAQTISDSIHSRRYDGKQVHSSSDS